MRRRFRPGRHHGHALYLLAVVVLEIEFGARPIVPRHEQRTAPETDAVVRGYKTALNVAFSVPVASPHPASSNPIAIHSGITYWGQVGSAVHRKMTISLDEAVYEGLYRTVGKRRMSQFIEDLLRPHVLDGTFDEGYKAMAADQAREAEAQSWCNGLVKDNAEEAR